MKVSLYVREHSSRKYRKATAKEPMGTTYVLRYGSTWETTDATNWTEATVARLRRETELVQGWKPAPKIKTQIATDLSGGYVEECHLCYMARKSLLLRMFPWVPDTAGNGL